MAKNVYCLEKNLSGNWRIVRISGLKKSVFSAVEVSDSFFPIEKAPAYISLNTKQYSISREFFPKLKSDVLELHINDKMKHLAFWGDVSDMKILWKTISETDKKTELALIACPLGPLDEIIDSSERSQVKINILSHFAVSIAALIGQITDEAVLAVIFDRDFLQLIAVQKTIPFYHQVVPMENDLVFDEVNVKQSIDLAQKTIETNYGIKISGIILFGENYKIIEKIIAGENIINANWDNILKCDNADDLIKYPSLFGIYFVDKSYNMLPSDILTSYLINDFLSFTGNICSAMCIFLIFLIFKFYFENNYLNSEFQRLSSEIKINSNRLYAKYPSPNEKGKIEKLVTIFNKYREQQRLDNLMADIASCLPPDVIVKKLSITLPLHNKKGQSVSVDSIKLTDELMLNLGKPYNLDIIIATKGEYFKTLQELNEVKKKLTDIFFLENTVLNYDETNLEGTLTCSFKY